VRVAVVGCGTGGPATALFLHRAGHQVEVFERVARLEPVGAGFMLQPTGLQVLAELGLLDRVLDFGERLSSLTCVNAGGRRLLDLHYGELAQHLYGVGIHRAAILETLVTAVGEAGIPLHLDHAVGAIDDDGTAVRLRTQHGEHGPFDLVVAADGARSGLRELSGIPCKVRRYRWGALWFMGHDPDQQFHDELFQIVNGTRELLGFLPTGKTPDSPSELVSLFWSIDVRTHEELRASSIKSWKSRVVELEPRAEALVAQIEDWDQLTLAVYHDVIMKSWHRGRVVFIGDAAHATSPQLGQGANLALCDAHALSQCLHGDANAAEALHRYDRARRHHLGFYQLASRWLTYFFQSHASALGPVRNLLFPLFMRIGPLRRQGIRTMAGLKRGIVRRSLPPPTV
jgi:2-polyprenyl-6-methoxyphenol hydroxylase-like FAD-dependent oxidoreductase